MRAVNQAERQLAMDGSDVTGGLQRVQISYSGIASLCTSISVFTETLCGVKP